MAFGSAALVVLGGGLCAAVVSGVAGQVVAIVLILGGLSGALLLVFLEIGLSEEREVAREEERRRAQGRTPTHPERRLRLASRPRRPG